MSSYINRLIKSMENLYNYLIQMIQTREERNEELVRPESNFASLISKLEQYIIPIQALLIWERPYISAVVLIAVNILFWYIVSLFKRVYSFVAIITLIIFGYKMGISKIWQEIRVPPSEDEDSESWIPVHPKVLSAPELSHYLDEGWKYIKQWGIWLQDLRNRNHGVFCFIISSVFGVLAFIGHIIPGVVITYTLLMTVLLGPGIVLFVLPPTLYDQLKDVIFPTVKNQNASTGQDNESETDEFLPNTSAIGEFSLLQETILTNDNLSEVQFEEAIAKELGIESLIGEEDDLSLYQGLENFPSVDDDEESADEIELPQPENANGEDNLINIVPTYYKEDSSDTENEELFSEGLTFTDVLDTDSNSNHESNNKSNKQTSENALHSSRHSDIDIDEYEIVSKSDLTS
ncbi:reticulophagy regulator 3 isoform X1 [Centruroides vittatus]|uniref:reticulophagy regulator 3 isoform X1 n=2 Tax=Centruroides vittatus TaxID=120091 RepID=UPI0035100519